MEDRYEMKTKVWAHRGASAYAPENTLEAFLLAAEQGADGVELDVQLTKDGEMVVVHDEEIDRVSDGSGFVKDYTLAELKNLNFNKTHLEYQNVKIPTLATVYKGNIIKNLIMDCQSYTKYRPNETTGGIFVSWRRKEELPTGA